MNYNDLMPNVKEWLESVQDDINPLKLVALADLLTIDLTENSEELTNFINEVELDSFDNLIVRYDGLSYMILDGQEIHEQIEYARENVIDDEKCVTPAHLREYVDWEQLAEDRICDIFDVYSDIMITSDNVEGELKDNPFTDYVDYGSYSFLIIEIDEF